MEEGHLAGFVVGAVRLMEGRLGVDDGRSI